jgi:hypothetical protein
MKIEARNREHRERYEVYLDGVNVSDCVQTADDVAHEVTMLIRRPSGELVKRDGRVLKVTTHGHVVIVSRTQAPALMVD